MKQPVYIVDIFRDIVQKVSDKITPQLQDVNGSITGVNYLVGHYVEIQERLTKKTDKYPLVALFQDFVESRGNVDYYASVNLQLMIVYYTSKTDYTEDRYTKVFKPILYPIYEELLRQIAKKVVTYGPDRLVHEKIDRPHWGNPKMYGNDGYILSDVLDGIELRNLKVTINQNCIN